MKQACGEGGTAERRLLLKVGDVCTGSLSPNLSPLYTFKVSQNDKFLKSKCIKYLKIKN